MSVRIVSGELSSSHALRELERHAPGGIVLFEGRVRPDSTPAGTVVALEYEADRRFALRAMRTLARDAERRYQLSGTVLWHRIGTVPVGATAVLIGAGALHRDQAFRATRELIDRLKAEVPLWKSDRVRPPSRHRPRDPRHQRGRSRAG